MGFGNPYGDEYDASILLHWAQQMQDLGIRILSLADTVGLAKPHQITEALQTLIPRHPSMMIGVHLHASPLNWKDKLLAAIEAGCLRVDGALKGIGGCPMAQDELVGNMDTEQMIPLLEEQQLLKGLNKQALLECSMMAASIFRK